MPVDSPVYADPELQCSLDQVRSLIDAGNHEKALAILRKLQARHGDSPLLKQLLGRAYLASGKAVEAVSALVEATEANPLDASCCVDLGKAVLSLGWADQSALAARRAVELDARSVDAFSLLGEALAAAGQHAEAYEAVRMGLTFALSQAQDSADAPPALNPPLVIGSRKDVFLDWTAQGNVDDLRLMSTASDKRTTIYIGLGSTTDLPQGNVVECGRIDSDRLLFVLPPVLAAKAELFTSADFPYVISRQG